MHLITPQWTAWPNALSGPSRKLWGLVRKMAWQCSTGWKTFYSCTVWQRMLPWESLQALGCELCTRLDLLTPQLESGVSRKQTCLKVQHDCQAEVPRAPDWLWPGTSGHDQSTFMVTLWRRKNPWVAWWKSVMELSGVDTLTTWRFYFSRKSPHSISAHFNFFFQPFDFFHSPRVNRTKISMRIWSLIF